MLFLCEMPYLENCHVLCQQLPLWEVYQVFVPFQIKTHGMLYLSVVSATVLTPYIQESWIQLTQVGDTQSFNLLHQYFFFSFLKAPCYSDPHVHKCLFFVVVKRMSSPLCQEEKKSLLNLPNSYRDSGLFYVLSWQTGLHHLINHSFWDNMCLTQPYDSQKLYNCVLELNKLNFI